MANITIQSHPPLSLNNDQNIGSQPKKVPPEEDYKLETSIVIGYGKGTASNIIWIFYLTIKRALFILFKMLVGVAGGVGVGGGGHAPPCRPGSCAPEWIPCMNPESHTWTIIVAYSSCLNQLSQTVIMIKL